jgi:tetratricopeptide (TPR) repeat protein
MDARSQLARAEDHRVQKNFQLALSQFLDVAGRAADPAVEAEALLGAGMVYTALGDYRQALDVLHRARARKPEGSVDIAIERALGEVYFLRRDYPIAYQRLKAVDAKVGGGDRGGFLLQLGISAHHVGKAAEGDRYIAQSRYRTQPELRRLLTEHLPDYREPGIAGPRAAPRREPDGGGSAGSVQVLSRSQWNASAIRTNHEPMRQKFRITVHHTGVVEPSHHSFEEAASVIRGIQRVHQRQRGWADIGYHFLIDRSGRIWQGRDLRYQGAHARGDANRGNIGIVLLGDFTRQKVTAAQSRSLTRFLDQLCVKHTVPRHRVYTHSEILDGKTDCPGPELGRIIHRFRSDGVAMAD